VDRSPHTLAAAARRCASYPNATRLDPDSYAATVFQFMAQFVVGRCGLIEDDVAAWVAEQRQLDEQGEFFFACIQFCFTARRLGASQRAKGT
jgi:hypothetical protein